MSEMLDIGPIAEGASDPSAYPEIGAEMGVPLVPYTEEMAGEMAELALTAEGPEGYVPNHDIARWGGYVAGARMLELTLPVEDVTPAERIVTPLLGDLMQVSRVMQEAVLATVIQTDLPPPTKTYKIPISLN